MNFWRRVANRLRRLMLPDDAPEMAMQTWLSSQGRTFHVHPSLEVTGVRASAETLYIGDEAAIERDTTVWLSPDSGANPFLHIGDRAFIGRNTYLGVFQPVSIGNSTMIGAYAYIISANHAYATRAVPMRDQGFTGAPIVIEDDVWIGTHVVVLPGVTIGTGAIVAAGSVVNKSIPPYEIWGGVPARFLKARPE